MVSVVCFGLSAVMELFIRIPYQKQASDGSVWSIIQSDMRMSARFVVKEQPVFFRVLCIIFGINLFMSSMLIIALPVLITKTLSLSTDLYGITQGALAAGGLLGGVLAGSVGNKLDIRKSYLLLVVSGIAIFPMGLVFLFHAPAIVCYLTLTVLSFFMMVCATMFSIQMLAFVQAKCPLEIVGKVIALVMALSMAAQPFGQAIYGFLFQAFASAPWIVLLFSGCVTMAVAVFSKKTFASLGS